MQTLGEPQNSLWHVKRKKQPLRKWLVRHTCCCRGRSCITFPSKGIQSVLSTPRHHRLPSDGKAEAILISIAALQRWHEFPMHFLEVVILAEQQRHVIFSKTRPSDEVEGFSNIYAFFAGLGIRVFLIILLWNRRIAKRACEDGDSVVPCFVRGKFARPKCVPVHILADGMYPGIQVNPLIQRRRCGRNMQERK